MNKVKNPDKKCLSCHRSLEEEYYFCSLTCMILCGFMSVRTDHPKRDVKELENEDVRNEFLNNPPLRGNYPDKEKYL